ncbi:hypothetical protein ACQUW5_06405 [Legionella sp. CNM-1927-20]|uniref:hypothetical protein n=1 Tax=Legionella sp. CNM-1927-20 TaxID=3422221 RepID=UPI00403AFE4E
MTWYIDALQPLVDKVPPEEQMKTKQFLYLCFDFFYWQGETGFGHFNPELEFFFGVIEKSYQKAKNYQPGTLSLEEFVAYILTLMTVYAKVSYDSFKLQNQDILDGLAAYKCTMHLSNVSLLMMEIVPCILIFSKDELKKREKILLQELGYQVKIDISLVKSILDKVDNLPERLKNWVTSNEDAYESVDLAAFKEDLSQFGPIIEVEEEEEEEEDNEDNEDIKQQLDTDFNNNEAVFQGESTISTVELTNSAENRPAETSEAQDRRLPSEESTIVQSEPAALTVELLTRGKKRAAEASEAQDNTPNDTANTYALQQFNIFSRPPKDIHTDKRQRNFNLDSFSLDGFSN